MILSSLTIVLPAFNEERVIEKTIDSCKKAAGQVASDYEILIVDDGSHDKTAEIVRRISRADSRVKGVFEPHAGYGKALSVGFYSAEKEFIFYTDSDAPIDIVKELPKAASLISKDKDAAIGYRINRKDIPLRRVYSIIYNFMNRVLLGIKVRDINFSCKLLRKTIFDRIRLYSRSVFIDAELLSNLAFYDFKIEEFPATYVPRTHGYSNFDSPAYAMKIFVEIVLFWIAHRLFCDKLKKNLNV